MLKVALTVGLALTGLAAGVEPGQPLSGMVTNDLALDATNAAYLVTGNLTVLTGATVRIGPGVRLELGPGVTVEAQDGARVLAEGTAEAPIIFSAVSGTTNRWGGIRVYGSTNSPESVFRHARLEGNNSIGIYSFAGSLALDHVEFGTTDRQYVSLDGCSFVISHCHFPSGTAQFELTHGRLGVKAGGHGIIRRSFFGSTAGYNDALDFTGGNRGEGPILQVINNVFMGSSDDILDLDGTDAWIEGNIFVRAHKNGAPDSAAAVSGGNFGTNTSEITIMGNLFFDCDQAATAKQGNFYTLAHNTIARITKAGGLDTDAGVIAMQDLEPRPTSFGAGAHFEGNVVVEAERLARNYDAAQSRVVFAGNWLPEPWAGPGGGNLTGDPKLRKIPELAETMFGTWAEAQVLRDWLGLAEDSPARGQGRGGEDWGAGRRGIRIYGEPAGVTFARSAELRVDGSYYTNGIPAAGWPGGAGYTHYRWRLAGGEWSGEISVEQPIVLTNLAPGDYQVEVAGKNDAGFYQNDALFGEDAVASISKAWRVEAGPVLEIARGGEGTLVLKGPAAGGARTFVEASENLREWRRIAEATEATSGTGGNFEVPVAAGGKAGYFRLAVER